MKKIFIALLLSAVMLLCGCEAVTADNPIESTAAPSSQATEAVISTPEPTVIETPAVTETPAATVTPAATATAAATNTPLPTPKPSVIVTPGPTPAVWVTEPPKPAADEKTALLNAVLARVQENADTGTFEGFYTKYSTLQDVVEHTGMELNLAIVSYAVDFLGYPANMDCYFRPALDIYRLYVLPEERTDYEAKITDLLNKLEGALGSQAKSEFQNNGSYWYRWDMPAYTVHVTAKAGDFERKGELAEVYVQGYQGFSPADLPDIFPYPPWTEFDTVYENELRPAAARKDFVYITYLVGDIDITFDFNTDDAFTGGHYMLDVDLPDAASAADFMEACMSGVQSVLGKPKDRKYSSSEGPFKTGEEMKASGCDWFHFIAHWDGISLDAYYEPDFNGIEFYLKFEEDYFKNAA